MRYILFSLLFLFTVRLFAGGLPDSLAVSKLYSTSWTLTAKYHPSGMFHRLKKMENPAELNITIYQNEIHTELTGGTYQICASRHRNQNEFWLDCKSADQVIYRVIRIEGDELAIDVFRRPDGKSAYKRTSRNYYRRKRN